MLGGLTRVLLPALWAVGGAHQPHVHLRPRADVPPQPVHADVPGGPRALTDHVTPHLYRVIATHAPASSTRVHGTSRSQSPQHRTNFKSNIGGNSGLNTKKSVLPGGKSPSVPSALAAARSASRRAASRCGVVRNRTPAMRCTRRRRSRMRRRCLPRQRLAYAHGRLGASESL